MKPPAWASALLALLYPEPLLEAVAGDLEEEFRQRARSEGAVQARHWYAGQVLASATAALQRRARQGEAAALGGIVLLTCALLWLLEQGGHFVLSQIPLKADALLPWWLEASRWSLGAVVSALGVYWWRQSRRRARTR